MLVLGKTPVIHTKKKIQKIPGSAIRWIKNTAVPKMLNMFTVLKTKNETTYICATLHEKYLTYCNNLQNRLIYLLPNRY